MTYKECAFGRIGVAFLLLSFLPSLYAELPAEEQAAVDRAVERTLARTGVPSASIAIVQDGKIAYARAYGLARLDGKISANPGMRYKIGSNSKQITATAMLLLADEGKVSLDDPVSRFFPDLTRAKEVTIRQLLSHTSGYEDYYALDYVAPYMVVPTTPQSIMNRWGRKPLNFDPGTRWQYSNTNFVIAGAIIEKLANQPLIEFLRSRIFSKLGIKSAIDVDRQPWGDGDPLGYTRFALGPSRIAVPEGKNWVFAAGELAMTPSDMARWDISLIDGTILKQSLLKELTTETHLKNGAGTGYGLGLGIGSRDGHRIWAHNGGTSGFVSANRTYPDDHMALAVFTNQDDPAAGDIAHEIQDLLLTPAQDSMAARDLDVIKKIYAELRSGHLDRARLTGDANAYFTSSAISDYATSLNPLGDPISIEQTGSENRGGMRYRFYRVKTASKALTISSFFTPDGKLDQFLVYPAKVDH